MRANTGTVSSRKIGMIRRGREELTGAEVWAEEEEVVSKRCWPSVSLTRNLTIIQVRAESLQEAVSTDGT